MAITNTDNLVYKNLPVLVYYIYFTETLTTSFIIYPGDLVFDPTSPSFDTEVAITKTNLLINFQDVHEFFL